MKKRVVSFLLTMVMVLTMITVAPVSVSATDTWSTEGTVHTISSADDLMAFASAITTSEHFSGHTVKLANDIDMSGKAWQGIGYANGSGAYFSGTFDGQGYSIQNISATAGSNDFFGALFRELANGAIVKNVALYGCIDLTRTSNGNTSYVGSVAAAVRAGTVTLQNIYSAVDLDASHIDDANPTNRGLNNVGGLVGTFLASNETFLTIDGCVYAGNISCNGTGNGGNRPHTFGGLVGWMNAPSTLTRKLYMKNSAFIGTFTAKSMNQFGAFVGAVYDNGSGSGKNLVWIDNCIAAGTVAINPTSSGRANYNGYLIGAYGNYLSAPNATDLTSSSATTRIYAQNCYYVSANYTKNANANNTFAQTAATQQLSNRTDRATYAGIAPSATDAGNTTNTGDYRVSNVTMEALGNLTAGTANFSDTSKWHFFEDGETPPYPTYIYENFYEAPVPVVTEFYIGSASELAAFASAVNGGDTYEGKTVYLTDDIDIGSDWTCIGQRTGGNTGTRFCGTFDGQGHTINFTGHTVSENTRGALFGYLGDGAVVKNLELTGTITTSGALNFIGTLANAVVMNVSVQNIHSDVRINGGGNLMYSGGLIGFMENGTYATNLTIDGCVYNGTINCGNQAKAIGGFVGYTGNIGDANKSLTIINSGWNGTIMLNDPSYSTNIGGFVGYQPGGNSNYTRITIRDCVAAGKFTFNMNNDWTGRDRLIAMTVGAGCVDVIDGVRTNDAKRNCPLVLTNVYYRNATDWAGGDIPQNNICDDPGNGKYTAPVYTNAVRKTVDELAALTAGTVGFSDLSAWKFTANTSYGKYFPCPVSFDASVMAIIQNCVVDADYRDTLTNSGIRFTATFCRTELAENGGTLDANFGLILITSANYNGESTLDDLVSAGAVYIKATRYKTVDGNYTISAVVCNIPAEYRDVEIVAIAYLGSTMSDPCVATYNSVTE